MHPVLAQETLSIVRDLRQVSTTRSSRAHAIAGAPVASRRRRGRAGSALGLALVLAAFLGLGRSATSAGASDAGTDAGITIDYLGSAQVDTGAQTGTTELRVSRAVLEPHGRPIRQSVRWTLILVEHGTVTYTLNTGRAWLGGIDGGRPLAECDSVVMRPGMQLVAEEAALTARNSNDEPATVLGVDLTQKPPAI